MENCLGNPKILANILAFLEGSNLADLEVVSREWNNCIAQSSLWKVRCMVDIERHELLDYISWHTIEKGELRFRGPLSDCTGEYWKRIYAEWWNGFTSIHHPYTTTQSTIELSEHESRKGTTVVTSAYMLGSWILVGTNNGEVFVYCRRQQKRIKTVQQHENRIISVLMFNERHVDKYDEDSKQGCLLDSKNKFISSCGNLL
ncbi:uncharacterized protein LOC134839986 [Symsagittifera roscoffensis]|uniref:uncharacterized protein LOC134839986 n=1 Tax=Symsagittifera roscoffensis TaxID=84072 RepID=UPI00307C5F09